MPLSEVAMLEQIRGLTITNMAPARQLIYIVSASFVPNFGLYHFSANIPTNSAFRKQNITYFENGVGPGEG